MTPGAWHQDVTLTVQLNVVESDPPDVCRKGVGLAIYALGTHVCDCAGERMALQKAN